MRMLCVAAAVLLSACGPRTIRRVQDPPARVEPEKPQPIETVAPAARPVLIDEPRRPDPAVMIEPARRDVGAVIAQTNATLVDAYFQYDRSELTDDALAALRQDAALLAPLAREFPQLEIVVEGHCDERGSAAYNLGLGARRAERAAAVLATLGIAPERMRTISYGNERPQCEVAAESCWRLNRRAHLELRLRPPASETGAS